MWEQERKVKRKGNHAKLYLLREECANTISESFPSDKPSHLQIFFHHLQTLFSFTFLDVPSNYSVEFLYSFKKRNLAKPLLRLQQTMAAFK